MTDITPDTLPDAIDVDMIERAVADAHYPALLMMLVHLTGDPDLLTPERRPAFTNFVENQSDIDPEVECEVRALAAAALGRHLAGDAPPPPSLDRATLLRMMIFLAGRDIPEHYLGFLEEELAIGDPDPRRPRWTVVPPSDPGEGPKASAVVIGAGMSGLMAAIRLRQAGIAVRVFEKNTDVGGTWFENTYPGCRVDSNNQTYSYSFALNPTWPQRFSTAPEILRYFQKVAHDFGLYELIDFETQVIEARYRAESFDWEITTDGPTGQARHIANYVISAVGQLNTPLTPDFPDADIYEGQAFHSARWQHDVDLTGKRVAVIGTGASAFQFVPHVAEQASEVLVFQRNPPWLMPTPEYHDDVPEPERWLLANGPYYANWYRFWQFWMFVDGLREQVITDPEFEGGGLAISESNAALRESCEAWIEAQAKDRPDLLPLLVPQYPVGGKRSLRDNGAWIEALKRDNVRIVTDPITGFHSKGLQTENGEQHDVDVVIYGTGFRASDFLSSMNVIGRSGKSLADTWQGEARAYLGMTIPDFPNLFCVFGPNTNLVVNGSIVFFSECAVAYILKSIGWMQANGVAAVDVKREVYDRYNAMIDAANEQMAWGSDLVTSWYKSSSGRVSQNWPLPTADYWLMTEKFVPAEYDSLHAQAAA